MLPFLEQAQIPDGVRKSFVQQISVELFGADDFVIGAPSKAFDELGQVEWVLREDEVKMWA